MLLLACQRKHTIFHTGKREGTKQSKPKKESCTTVTHSTQNKRRALQAHREKRKKEWKEIIPWWAPPPSLIMQIKSCQSLNSMKNYLSQFVDCHSSERNELCTILVSRVKSMCSVWEGLVTTIPYYTVLHCTGTHPFHIIVIIVLYGMTCCDAFLLFSVCLVCGICV